MIRILFLARRIFGVFNADVSPGGSEVCVDLISEAVYFRSKVHWVRVQEAQGDSMQLGRGSIKKSQDSTKQIRIWMTLNWVRSYLILDS